MTQLSTEINSKTVKQLQSFCRGEMSAVESYTSALLSDVVKPFAPTLRACRQSHRERVRILTRAIANLNGKVPETSGAWGALTEAIEGTAAALGAGQAIATLQEGEEHGLRDYLADLDNLSTDARTMIERQVMPAQRETTRLVTQLRDSLH